MELLLGINAEGKSLEAVTKPLTAGLAPGQRPIPRPILPRAERSHEEGGAGDAGTATPRTA